MDSHKRERDIGGFDISHFIVLRSCVSGLILIVTVEQLKLLKGYFPQNLDSIQNSFEPLYKDLTTALITAFGDLITMQGGNVWDTNNCKTPLAYNPRLNFPLITKCLRYARQAQTCLIQLRTLYTELLQVFVSQTENISIRDM